MNSINEIWRPVPGYETLYEGSNLGRIASLNYRGTGKRVVLKLTTKNRYIKVTLKDLEGHYRTFWVHRIIGVLFLPPPKPGQKQINHINGVKTDNRACNLEWCTGKENIANPNTKPNMSIRYHKQGEFERRSAGQKERFRKHPEHLQKMWDGRRRWLANRL